MVIVENIEVFSFHVTMEIWSTMIERATSGALFGSRHYLGHSQQMPFSVLKDR